MQKKMSSTPAFKRLVTLWQVDEIEYDAGTRGLRRKVTAQRIPSQMPSSSILNTRDRQITPGLSNPESRCWLGRALTEAAILWYPLNCRSADLELTEIDLETMVSSPS